MADSGRRRVPAVAQESKDASSWGWAIGIGAVVLVGVVGAFFLASSKPTAKAKGQVAKVTRVDDSKSTKASKPRASQPSSTTSAASASSSEDEPSSVPEPTGSASASSASASSASASSAASRTAAAAPAEDAGDSSATEEPTVAAATTDPPLVQLGGAVADDDDDDVDDEDAERQDRLRRAEAEDALASEEAAAYEQEAERKRADMLEALHSELSEAPREVELEPDGALTRDSLLLILKDLTRRILAKRAELREQVEAGALPKSDFERRLAESIPMVEKQVNDEFGVLAEPVFLAQSKHQEDPEIMAISRELRNAALPDFAARAMSDVEEMAGTQGRVPEGMTAERMADLVRANAEATIRRIKAIVAEVKETGKEGRDALELFQSRFLARAKKLTADTFDEIGISAEDFAAASMHFMQTGPMIMAQQEAQQRLMICQQVNMMELSTRMSRADAIQALGIPAEQAEFL